MFTFEKFIIQLLTYLFSKTLINKEFMKSVEQSYTLFKGSFLKFPVIIFRDFTDLVVISTTIVLKNLIMKIKI